MTVSTCKLWQRMFWVLWGAVIAAPVYGLSAVYPIEQRGQERNHSADTSHSKQVAADTGELLTGNRDFSRYVSPVMCVQAAELAARRSLATIDAQAKSQAMQYTPFLDTTPASVVTVARACGARFSAGDQLFTGPYGLDNLKSWFVLSLLERNDSLSHTLQDRILDAVTKREERDRVSLWILDQYLRARPIRISAARALTARLDSSGRPSLLSRVMAHDRLLNIADTAFDRQMMRDEAEQVVALSSGLTVEEMCWTSGVSAMIHAHTSQMTAAAIDHPDSLAGFVDQLQTQFRLPAVQQCVELRRNTMFPLKDYSKLTVPMVVEDILSEHVGLMSVHLGHVEKQAPVVAPKWFPAAAQDARVPAPSKVSMILFLPTDMRWSDGYQKINVELRRWIARYGAAGLSVSVIAAPHGNALWGGPETSAELGKLFDWYYHDYLKLPVTVGLDSASRLPRVPDPDGRIHYGTSVLEEAWRISYAETKNGSPNYWYRNDGMVILVDRTGNVIYRAELGGTNAFGLSPVLETLLVRAFPSH